MPKFYPVHPKKKIHETDRPSLFKNIPEEESNKLFRPKNKLQAVFLEFLKKLGFDQFEAAEIINSTDIADQIENALLQKDIPFIDELIRGNITKPTIEDVEEIFPIEASQKKTKIKTI